MVTTRTAIKNLKPGKYCIIDGEPYKVLSMTTSVAGKHGGAKARLEAIGVFDNKKRSIVKPASYELDIPIVDKRNAQVVAMAGETAQLMDLETYDTFDAVVPEELKDQIKQGGEIQYWVLMGRKMIVSIRS